MLKEEGGIKLFPKNENPNRPNAAKRIDFKFTTVQSVLNKLGLLKEGKLLKAAEVLFCDDNQLEVQAAVFAGTDKLTFLDI